MTQAYVKICVLVEDECVTFDSQGCFLVESEVMITGLISLLTP